MAMTKSFGRRTGPSPRPAKPASTPAKERVVSAPAAVNAPDESVEQTSTDTNSSVDKELREWKEARGARIPWRQLTLMASLSFGTASVVLSGSVGEAVDLLLYGLSGASLYFWWSGRGKSRS